VRELIPTGWLLLEVATKMYMEGGEMEAIKSTVFEDNHGVITTAKTLKAGGPRTSETSVQTP
jgi:hypothetical protein